jgi:hypothetical protein
LGDIAFPRTGLHLGGGTLIGVRQGDLDAEEMGEGRFYSSIRIRNRDDGFCWEVINVYGSVQYEHKGQFLQELYQKIRGSIVPVMVGGDLNMIRYAQEKKFRIRLYYLDGYV